MMFLRRCGLQNTDHVMPFWLFAPATAKEKTASKRDVENKDRSKLYPRKSRGDLYFVVSAVVLCSLKCSCFRGVGEAHRRFAGSFTIVLSVLTFTA